MKGNFYKNDTWCNKNRRDKYLVIYLYVYFSMIPLFLEV